jgi:hypothetical protein
MEARQVRKERRGSMKRLWILGACLLQFIAFLDAQTFKSPAGTATFYRHTIALDAAYTSSQNDTSGSVTIGGATYLTVTVTVNDSAKLDYYVDKRIRNAIGVTTWTNIITDSLINTSSTSNSGLKQEYILRLPGTEKLDGMDVNIRTRKAWRASQPGTSSATYSEILNWKP